MKGSLKTLFLHTRHVENISIGNRLEGCMLLGMPCSCGISCTPWAGASSLRRATKWKVGLKCLMAVMSEQFDHISGLHYIDIEIERALSLVY